MNNLYNQVRSYLRIDTEMKERKYGFKDACSRLVELDETIQLPSGYRLINGPKEDTMQGTGADFEGSLLQKGNRVVLHNRLALKSVYMKRRIGIASVKRWKLIKHTVIIW